MNKLVMAPESFFDELPKKYCVQFMAQEKNVFHGIQDESEWISKALHFQMVRIGDLADLQTKYFDHNLYRSWMVYDENKQEIGRIPAYLDIDGDPGNPDLDAARQAAKWAIDTAKQAHQLKDDNFRVVFSGQKGFHIEVRKPGEFSKEIYESLKSHQKFNTYFKNITLDRPWNILGVWKKNYIRLHDSINTTDQGMPPRRCFAMTVDKFRNTPLDKILQASALDEKMTKMA